MPSPIASRIGKPNDQKIASGSRRNSLNRTLINSRRLDVGSLIAQLSPGERHEHVFETRGMCGQVLELGAAAREQRKQLGHRAMERFDLQLISAGHAPNRTN